MTPSYEVGSYPRFDRMMAELVRQCRDEDRRLWAAQRERDLRREAMDRAGLDTDRMMVWS